MESETVMNYYEFLNKQLETPQGQQIGQSKIKQPTSGNEPIFNNDTPTVQLNGKHIFSKADKTEVNEINFDKLASEEAMTDENQKFSALEFVLKTFLSIDKIKNLADKDGDGKITTSDLTNYSAKLQNQGMTYQELAQLCQNGSSSMSSLLDTVLSNFSKIDIFAP